MDQVEDGLRRYCDLTESQWWDLEQACEGSLRTMNGARRLVMADLIGEDLRATVLGMWVALRAQAIVEGRFQPVVRNGLGEVTPSKVTQFLKRVKAGSEFFDEWGGYFWLTSANVKLMASVYRYPDEVVGWLRTVYGQETIRNCVVHGWLSGTMRRWSCLDVTPLGVKVLLLGLEKVRG